MSRRYRCELLMTCLSNINAHAPFNDKVCSAAFLRILSSERIENMLATAHESVDATSITATKNRKQNSPKGTPKSLPSPLQSKEH